MIGKRIKEARKVRSVSRPQLSAATGIPYPTLAGIENGDQGSTTQLDVIANALQVRVEWLRTGRGQMDAGAPGVDSEDWPDIRAYRQAAALGDGAVVDEYAETHALKFRAQSLQRKRLNPERLGVVYGRGESMLPRIKSGDAIMFDTSDTEPRDGHLYVVSYGGTLLAKQLSLLGGRWFIESLNKDDPKWRKPEPIDEHKGFKIHGRVRWIGSWED
jgi:phage repressor protein C with HTH and peptisase S24 domain